jgi:nucleoside-diphosphate-sugar epimerase
VGGFHLSTPDKVVLLTGGSGFIGRHCVEPLRARGYEVHATSTRGAVADMPDVHWHQCNLLEQGSARRVLAEVKPTHLLHLAWFVVPGKLITSQENYEWVRASMELVREFAAAGGKRLTFCGSGYEYDWRYGFCNEQLTAQIPNTVYGACKQALNLMTENFAATENLSSAWGRVFFLYGPYEHPQRLVSSIILSLLRGEPAKSSHGRQIRDYMHVQDVADGLVTVLDSEIRGTVNVSSGRATQIRDIVLTLGKLLGRPELIQLGALPARANDAPMVVGDNTRISTELRWQPKFDLDTGLKHTIDWWRAEQARK